MDDATAGVIDDPEFLEPTLRAPDPPGWKAVGHGVESTVGQKGSETGPTEKGRR